MRCANKMQAAEKQKKLAKNPFRTVDKLTNRKCRQCLHIEDVDVAKRLMKGMGISYQGINKGRQYWMTAQEVEKC